MNFDLVAPFLFYLLSGLGVTLVVTLISGTLGVLLGLAGCFCRVSERPAFRIAAALFVTLFRSLPELLTILFTFYGLQLAFSALDRLIGLDLSPPPLVAAVLALTLHFGAYSLELFRDAFLTIPRGQVEAGQAVGLSASKVRTRILVPLMLRTAGPSLGNLLLVLLKFSSLASVIGLQELTRRSSIVAGTTHAPIQVYGVAAVCYLVITAALLHLKSVAEKSQSKEHGEVTH